VDGLLSDDPAEMAVIVDRACLDAESPNDFFTQNYPFHLDNGSGTFRSDLAQRLAGTGLTPDDIAARAQFAGSCIGCHQEGTGLFLGRGVFAPFSNGFVHVDEFFSEDCGDGTECFGASQALTNVFLPRRMRAMTDLLDRPVTCGAADGGVPPLPDADGGAGSPVADGGGCVDALTRPPPAAAPPPATVLSPTETVEDLVDEEAAVRGAMTGATLGGEPAGVTH
jgi:hypothetical protein